MADNEASQLAGVSSMSDIFISGRYTIDIMAANITSSSKLDQQTLVARFTLV